MEYIVNGEKYDVRPEAITYEDVCEMVPKLCGHEKLVKRVIRLLGIDRVNRTHAACADTPGPEFVRRLLDEQFRVKLDVDNEQVLDHLPEGAFITVSNHPLGALDGIALIHLIASRRPKYKVMVNMILSHLSAMRPNFIAVDQSASSDPAKRAVSVAGIRQAFRQLADGEPLGFFPAGAMSKTNKKYKTVDREWQDSVLQIIWRAKVPVIPIFFHDKNSLMFNILGHVCWPARSLRLPREVFRFNGKTLHISVGDIISVDEQRENATDPKSLGDYLRKKTYELRGGE